MGWNKKKGQDAGYGKSILDPIDVNTVQTTRYCKIKNTTSTNFTSTNEVIQNTIHCSESVPSLPHSSLS